MFYFLITSQTIIMIQVIAVFTIFHNFSTHIYHEFKCGTFLEPANFLDSFEKLENFNDFSVEGF
jgi:hypothetical protein